MSFFELQIQKIFFLKKNKMKASQNVAAATEGEEDLDVYSALQAKILHYLLCQISRSLTIPRA